MLVIWDQHGPTSHGWTGHLTFESTGHRSPKKVPCRTVQSTSQMVQQHGWVKQTHKKSWKKRWHSCLFVYLNDDIRWLNKWWHDENLLDVNDAALKSSLVCDPTNYLATVRNGISGNLDRSSGNFTGQIDRNTMIHHDTQAGYHWLQQVILKPCVAGWMFHRTEFGDGQVHRKQHISAIE